MSSVVSKTCFAVIRVRSNTPTGEEFIDLNSFAENERDSIAKSKAYSALIRHANFDPEIQTPSVRVSQVEVREV